jgi:hypothetical protein
MGICIHIDVHCAYANGGASVTALYVCICIRMERCGCRGADAATDAGADAGACRGACACAYGCSDACPATVHVFDSVDERLMRVRTCAYGRRIPPHMRRAHADATPRRVPNAHAYVFHIWLMRMHIRMHTHMRLHKRTSHFAHHVAHHTSHIIRRTSYVARHCKRSTAYGVLQVHACGLAHVSECCVGVHMHPDP